ncbi:prepilin peptidase [Proteiniclasticum ruminis]|uniref:Prepilin leader peptidase/N-methyltransferase n=1 Tax=Proteiniclasticum ruminis TaxID=398199 RepID=A0A1G8KKF1_9CLOT|nr:A24 family peptidase [Proteiniclasticum ruminis]SDI43878.1 leader peptidase (prepilin peptidase) / N-methyltransferase [Proteiniclasticum ruminis]
MHPLILVYTFILGTLIGSFLNVVVYRVPREESLSFPPSHCPSCNTRLKAYDLVPVVSYLFLGGKCRTCKTAISIRYPLVEMLTGLLFLVTVIKFGVSLEGLKYLLVIALLLPVALIDYDHTIIPDRLNVGIFLTALIFLLLEVYLGNAAFRDLLNPLYGMVLGGGFFLFIAVVTKGAMGGGDIKLMAALGFLFGTANTLLLMFLSFVLGGFLSSLLLLLKIKKRKDYIPFGPFICASALLVIFYGEPILSWYLNIG